MRRVRAIITGRVQGVSFRASTATRAHSLGVVGWVKNRSDGAVELEAEGDATQIAELLAWCENGPPTARVMKVAIEELAPTRSDTTFAITR